MLILSKTKDAYDRHDYVPSMYSMLAGRRNAFNIFQLQCNMQISPSVLAHITRVVADNYFHPLNAQSMLDAYKHKSVREFLW